MVRRGVALLSSLAVAAVGLGGWAAEGGGLSGTIGVEAALLPRFSTDVWLDLDGRLDGWSFGSLLEVSALPGVGVSWTGSIGTSFGPIDLGGTAEVDVYPFALGGFDLHAEVELLDVSQDGFEMSIGARLFSKVYPVFGNVLSLGVDASYGIFSLWADFDLTLPPFGVSVLLAGEVRLLDLDLEEGSLTADLGSSTFVVPALDAQLWFDVTFEFGDVVVTSETDFVLTPFGLTEQRFEVELGLDGLTIYAWGSLSGGGDLSAGVGGSYSFP